jgi:hypothetical protein
MKKIIEIKEVKEDYYSCNACSNKENLIEILIGKQHGESSIVAGVRVCKYCRTELMSKLICLYKKEG